MGSMLGEELNLKNDNSNILLNSVQNDVSKELRELPLNELLSNSLREVISTKQREILFSCNNHEKTKRYAS